jgi:hypothetical protein
VALRFGVTKFDSLIVDEDYEDFDEGEMNECFEAA